MRKKLIILLIAIAALVISIKFFPYHCNCSPKPDPGQVAIAGTILNVITADTLQEQSQGLSGRSSLKEDEGMLFVFDKPGNYGFWMKDMRFSLDIIWINEKKEFIGAAKSLSPDTYPEVFYPPGMAKYVLEVSAGFVDKNEIHVGEKIIGIK